MNEAKWMSNKTYEEMLNEVLSNYKNFSWDKLNKNFSYHIGFRHHDSHMFKSDLQRVWFIQKVDIKSLNESGQYEINTDNDIFIDSQKPVKINFDFRIMAENNKRSLGRYLKSAETTSPLMRPLIHYGYILRGNFDNLYECSNILMESELYKKIRNLIYNLPKKSHIILNYTNRKEYLALRAYLHHTNKNVFRKLFPQYSNKYDTYDEFINKLVDRILQCYRNKNIILKTYIHPPCDGQDTSSNPQGVSMINHRDMLAKFFINYINKAGGINAFNPSSKSIIYDYVMNVNNIEILSKAFGIL
jgi:hypothetical protein